MRKKSPPHIGMSSEWLWVYKTPRCNQFIPQYFVKETSQWRHWYERHDVSNHRKINCFFNCELSLSSKKIPKPALLDHCEGNPPVTDGFPLRRVSNACYDVIKKLVVAWLYIGIFLEFINSFTLRSQPIYSHWAAHVVNIMFTLSSFWFSFLCISVGQHGPVPGSAFFGWAPEMGRIQKG